MSEEKTLIEKLKIVLGLATQEVVELAEEEEEVVEEVVEEEVVEEEVVEEEVKASITPEEQTAIVSEIMQILEPRIMAIEEAHRQMEEAMLMLGDNYKKETEELKSQVQKLAAEPGADPIKQKIKLPDGDNALFNLVKNRK